MFEVKYDHWNLQKQPLMTQNPQKTLAMHCFLGKLEAGENQTKLH